MKNRLQAGLEVFYTQLAAVMESTKHDLVRHDFLPRLSIERVVMVMPDHIFQIH